MRKKDSNIIYMIFILLFALPTLTYGQTKTITGTVVSAGDNMPFPGATVFIKASNIGVSTDFDGNYSIKANTGDV